MSQLCDIFVFFTSILGIKLKSNFAENNSFNEMYEHHGLEIVKAYNKMSTYIDTHGYRGKKNYPKLV